VRNEKAVNTWKDERGRYRLHKSFVPACSESCTCLFGMMGGMGWKGWNESDRLDRMDWTNELDESDALT
jgi:hypothetical protein